MRVSNQTSETDNSKSVFILNAFLAIPEKLDQVFFRRAYGCEFISPPHSKMYWVAPDMWIVLLQTEAPALLSLCSGMKAK